MDVDQSAIGGDSTNSDSAFIHSVLSTWLSTLRDHRSENLQDSPNYYVCKPEYLLTTTTPFLFSVGSGADLFNDITLSLAEIVQEELLLVTCFWAKSETQRQIRELLLILNAKAGAAGERRIRVRICISSLSLFQKLLHTQSLDGQTYPPSSWPKRFGLPKAEDVPFLDVEIKSVFVKPFSVMHPKFVVADRKRVWMPSCNVSWEKWCEGYIEMTGPIVQQFLMFYEHFWRRNTQFHVEESLGNESPVKALEVPDVVVPCSSLGLPSSVKLPYRHIRTVFLPSPHHLNPFQQLPPTPLNSFLLTLFSTAQSFIQIFTPNLTSRPVIVGLLGALERGWTWRSTCHEGLCCLSSL